MIEILLFVLSGIGLGILTGLVPGLHVNTLIPILMSLIFFIANPYYLAVLIVSIAITQTFVSYIPSIFLGVPDADTALSVLPGHRLLLEGNGFEAIKLTVLGSIGSLITTLLIISVFSNLFDFLYDISRSYIHFVIAGVVLFMIVSEKKLKRILFAILVISLSGFLGVLVLSSAIVNQQNVLFPTLSGLFGLSLLIVSISQISKIPDQKECVELKISKKDIIKAVVLGSIAGIIVGFLPAVGVSQAAIMMQYAGGLGEARAFLVTMSGVNLSNEVFSLISLYLVENPRSGASVAIERIMTELTFFDILLFIGVICFVTGIAALATLYLGRKVPKILARLNYKKLCLGIILFITSMILFLTGVFGLLIAFTATAIGVLCNELGIRKSNCMGVLLIPTILFFAGLNPFVITILRI